MLGCDGSKGYGDPFGTRQIDPKCRILESRRPREVDRSWPQIA